MLKNFVHHRFFKHSEQKRNISAPPNPTWQRSPGTTTSTSCENARRFTLGCEAVRMQGSSLRGFRIRRKISLNYRNISSIYRKIQLLYVSREALVQMKQCLRGFTLGCQAVKRQGDTQGFNDKTIFTLPPYTYTVIGISLDRFAM